MTDIGRWCSIWHLPARSVQELTLRKCVADVDQRCAERSDRRRKRWPRVISTSYSPQQNLSLKTHVAAPDARIPLVTNHKFSHAQLQLSFCPLALDRSWEHNSLSDGEELLMCLHLVLPALPTRPKAFNVQVWRLAGKRSSPMASVGDARRAFELAQPMAPHRHLTVSGRDETPQTP